MSPPIFTPDGSKVSEVILPDGATASKVIAPDGSTVVSAIPDSGVSRWEFEQDATDSWGNNNGTLQNSPSFTTDSDTGQYALSLNGSDQYVSLPDFNIVPPATIHIRANSDDSNQTSRIFDHDGSRIMIAYEETGSNGFEGQVFDGSEQNITSGITTTNQYECLTLVVTNSDAEFYVEGKSQGSVNHSGVDTSNDKNALGRASDSSSTFFSGIIDDARYYDKALTGTEVSDLCSTGSIQGG